jgi:hypothetical protein
VQAHPITKAKNTYSDGRIYKGPFQNGQPNGRGTMTYRDGTKIKDTFINGVSEKYNQEAPNSDEGEPKKDNTYSKLFEGYTEVLNTMTTKINTNQSFSRKEWIQMINRIHTDKLPLNLKRNQAFLDLLKVMNGELDKSKNGTVITISTERMQEINKAFKNCTRILSEYLPFD